MDLYTRSAIVQKYQEKECLSKAVGSGSPTHYCLSRRNMICNGSHRGRGIVKFKRSAKARVIS